MTKIKKINFINHPVLHNLELDFCNNKGEPLDTIIIAGENGTGKSTILDCLFKLSAGEIDYSAIVDLYIDGKSIQLSFRQEEDGLVYYTSSKGYKKFRSYFIKEYNTSGIFSDVEINFNTDTISNVTSMNIDSANISRKSNKNMSKEIEQLIIDIQALDDAALAQAYRKAVQSKSSLLDIDRSGRMPRFTQAFDKIFDSLKYDRVDNVNGHKEIFFKKDGIDIPLKALSSGEKQVVYRGCFLLKDKNALNGATVLIDEPEISLHPSWQYKILDYYKDIFTDENGIQTSQLFIATHSPFIIHNNNRKNDKVIVLKRDNGEIIVEDKPEYYKCDSLEVVEDAFNITTFLSNNNLDSNIVFLEGRTDEIYFNKAIEVFDYNNLPFSFKWVGYLDENDEERCTGKENLSKVADFLIGGKLKCKYGCLFDCDANKENKRYKNITIRSVSFNNHSEIINGIENSLILDDINYSMFVESKEVKNKQGFFNTIRELNKMKLCEYICSLDKEKLSIVFTNLRHEIDNLVDDFRTM